MSLIKADPYVVPYTVKVGDPYLSPEQVEPCKAVPAGVIDRVHQKLKDVERPRVSYQDDHGAMMLEAFNAMQRAIREVIKELEPYV